MRLLIKVSGVRVSDGSPTKEGQPCGCPSFVANLFNDLNSQRQKTKCFLPLAAFASAAEHRRFATKRFCDLKIPHGKTGKARIKMPVPVRHFNSAAEYVCVVSRMKSELAMAQTGVQSLRYKCFAFVPDLFNDSDSQRAAFASAVCSSVCSISQGC